MNYHYFYLSQLDCGAQMTEFSVSYSKFGKSNTHIRVMLVMLLILQKNLQRLLTIRNRKYLCMYLFYLFIIYFCFFLRLFFVFRYSVSCFLFFCFFWYLLFSYVFVSVVLCIWLNSSHRRPVKTKAIAKGIYRSYN